MLRWAIRLVAVTGLVTAFQGPFCPLGIERGRFRAVADGDLHASSIDGTETVADSVRFHGENAWNPTAEDQSESWVQLTLEETVAFTAIGLQGAFSSCWVSIGPSLSELIVFAANNDASEAESFFVLPVPVVGKMVRLSHFEASIGGAINLRLEVYTTCVWGEDFTRQNGQGLSWKDRTPNFTLVDWTARANAPNDANNVTATLVSTGESAQNGRRVIVEDEKFIACGTLTEYVSGTFIAGGDLDAPPTGYMFWGPTVDGISKYKTLSMAVKFATGSNALTLVASRPDKVHLFLVLNNDMSSLLAVEPYDQAFLNTANKVWEYSGLVSNTDSSIQQLQVAVNFSADRPAEELHMDDLYITGELWESNCTSIPGGGCCNNGYILYQGSCVACPAGSFADATPNATICMPCHVAAGLFSATAAAASCTLLTMCADGNFTVQEPTATSDRVCGITTCPAGTFVSSPLTATTDRECTACTLDVGFSNTINAAACTPVASCDAGTYINVSATASSDRNCGACADGQFSNASNSARCDGYTQICSAGTYEQTAPSSTNDRVCLGCTLDVDFSATSNQKTCSAVSVCSGDLEYQTRSPTVSNDRECDTLSVCDFPTQYESISATFTSDRNCSTSAVCMRGQDQTQALTPTSDRICINCLPGKFDADGDATTPCEPCESGFSDHDSDPTTACELCSVGTYVASGHFGNCTQCRSGTSDQDSNPRTPCDTCTTVGYHQPTGSAGSCLAQQFECPAGTTDEDEQTSTPCVSCYAGFYTAATTSGPCTPCAAGTTDDDAQASTVCVSCGAGHFVPPQSVGPCIGFKCPAGQPDHDENAATNCFSCSLFEYGIHVPLGAVGPCHLFNCSAGTASLSADLPCKECLEEQFQNLEGQKTCLPCENFCEETSFEAVSCSNITNRECQTCRTCVHGILTNCSLTADTVCMRMPDTSATDADGAFSLGLVAAGAGVGVLLLLLLLVLLVRRHRRKAAKTGPTMSGNDNDKSIYHTPQCVGFGRAINSCNLRGKVDYSDVASQDEQLEVFALNRLHPPVNQSNLYEGDGKKVLYVSAPTQASSADKVNFPVYSTVLGKGPSWSDASEVVYQTTGGQTASTDQTDAVFYAAVTGKGTRANAGTTGEVVYQVMPGQADPVDDIDADMPTYAAVQVKNQRHEESLYAVATAAPKAGPRPAGPESMYAALDVEPQQSWKRTVERKPNSLEETFYASVDMAATVAQRSGNIVQPIYQNNESSSDGQ